MKFAPLTVMVAREVPAAIDAGLTEAMVGPVTVNAIPPDVAPALATVTLTGPATANWTLETAAVSDVELENMVASGVRPQYTVEPLTKLVPVTVSVNPALPAVAAMGFNKAMEGPSTRNAAAGEVAALEFWTVMPGDPAAASCAPVTAAVSEVALA